jgi:hypothetical protein
VAWERRLAYYQVRSDDDLRRPELIARRLGCALSSRTANTVSSDYTCIDARGRGVYGDKLRYGND